MIKRLLISGLSILIVWTVFDVLMHRLLLRQIYEENASLWRPFDQMNVVLIYIVTFILIGTFVGTYWLLVRPKSLAAGIRLGAFLGLALGISVGFGTYIHMPIPQALAWGWLIGGWLKGIAAGAIVGMLISES
jgi:polyferredoxin